MCIKNIKHHHQHCTIRISQQLLLPEHHPTELLACEAHHQLHHAEHLLLLEEQPVTDAVRDHPQVTEATQILHHAELCQVLGHLICDVTALKI